MNELTESLGQLQTSIDDLRKQLDTVEQLEQKHSAQLAVMRQVTEVAARTDDIDALLQAATDAIHEHFTFFDVTVLLVSEQSDELELKAISGAYQEALTPQYRQRIGQGIIGWVAQNEEPILINDVAQEPRYLHLPDPSQDRTRAELAVPIRSGPRLLGVLDVQSEIADAFDNEDLNVMQALADLLANAISGIGRVRGLETLRRYSEDVINALPESVAVLNLQGRIVSANQHFCDEVKLHREQVVDRLITDLVDPSLVERIDLMGTIGRVLESGDPATFREVLHLSPLHPPQLLEVRVTRVVDVGRLTGAERRRALLVVDDITERERMTYELRTLFQVAQAVESTLDIHRLLSAILTCVTAGTGLGFNRAVLFLPNDDRTALHAVMAVGPANESEAHQTWTRLASEKRSLEQYLEELTPDSMEEFGGFTAAVMGLSRPIDEPGSPLSVAWSSQQVVKMSNPSSHPNLDRRLRDVLVGTEAVCVPLVAKGRSLGLIIADNAFSHQPIGDGELHLLRLFALSAGLALDNARTYEQMEQQAKQLEDTLEELKSTQEQLLHAERLATIGEIVARVSHEIRNPLTSIGGFARALRRRPDDSDRVTRNSGIIVEEVEKLEALLKEMLDFTSPKPPQIKPVSINDLIATQGNLHAEELTSKYVTMKLELDYTVPPVLADSRQLEQVFLNLWQNAVHAMDDDGPAEGPRMLTVRTWQENDMVKVAFSDTGRGIAKEVLPNVFTPFFTTKHGGSGLGLAVAKKIIDDHQGSIEVNTEVGRGTTFIIGLPIAR